MTEHPTKGCEVSSLSTFAFGSQFASLRLAIARIARSKSKSQCQEPSDRVLGTLPSYPPMNPGRWACATRLSDSAVSRALRNSSQGRKSGFAGSESTFPEPTPVKDQLMPYGMQYPEQKAAPKVFTAPRETGSEHGDFADQEGRGKPGVPGSAPEQLNFQPDPAK